MNISISSEFLFPQFGGLGLALLARRGLRLGLGLALTLFFVAESMAAQIGQQCLKAASLWMPQEAAPEVRVEKWNNTAIGYQITAEQHSADIVKLIEQDLQTQSQEAGLKVSTGSGFGVDLYIAVIPNLAALASPAMRENLADYFQDFYRKSNMQATFEIDAAKWDATFRDITPKCVGSTLTYHHAVERAFFAVQGDQNNVCINIGIGEILGLRNIRKYYFDHGFDAPSDLIAPGLQTLYDKRIVAGMSRLDASSKLEEICHDGSRKDQ